MKKKPAGTKSTSLARLTLLAILIAVEILMAFTPLGYLRLPTGAEITLLPIPVAVGAIVLGPLAGGILGTVFGLTSFAMCFGASAGGVILLQISPVKTVLLTVVTRLLMGVCVGWIHQLMSKIKYKKYPTVVALCTSALLGVAMTVLVDTFGTAWWVYLVAALIAVVIGISYRFIAALDSASAPAVLASCSAAILNTVFYVAALVFFFGSEPQVLAMFQVESMGAMILALVSLNAVVEAAACLLVGTGISRILAPMQEKFFKKPEKKAAEEADSEEKEEPKKKKSSKKESKSEE